MQENRKKNIENSRQNSHNERKGKRAPALGKGRRGGQKEIGSGRESDMDRIRRLRPMDDAFMRHMLRDDEPLAEFILRIVTGIPDLKVVKIVTQRDMSRLAGSRAIILDAYVVDSMGRVYDIEIQRQSGGADPSRARYHASALDVENLGAGQAFSELPETYTIFITEKDVFGEGKPAYPIERINTATGKPFGDGEHILYVNGAYRGDDPVGWLMHDFGCSSADEMHYGQMAEKTRYLKESEKGVLEMGSVLDEMREEYEGYGRAEGLEEGRREGRRENASMVAQRMLDAGKYSIREVAHISGLSRMEVCRLAMGHWHRNPFRNPSRK